jgi:hypothetical protein
MMPSGRLGSREADGSIVARQGGSIRLASAAAILLWGLAGLAPAQAPGLGQWLEQLEGRLPRAVADCTPQRRQAVAEAAEALEDRAAQVALLPRKSRPEEVFAPLVELLVAQQRIDRMLDTALVLRTRFAAAPAGPGRQVSLVSYLRITSSLIDLAGRMRYQLRDALDHAAHRLAGRPDLRDRLIDLLAQHRSSIGAAVLSDALFLPPPDGPNGAVAASAATKARVLELIAVTGEFTQLARLAAFARRDDTPGELVVLAADAIRRVGLPQDKRPGGDASQPDEPSSEPPITAASLYERVERTKPSELSGPTARLREDLLTWLAGRKARGLERESYRLGPMELRPGDWVLMRNPSPYNLFTYLSPGLFTHVGVVALETGADGRRRIVVVDVPERGRQVPATNLEVYVQRSLHYLFLRHPDEKVAKQLGDAAASVIGNELEFDLNFRTDRIAALKGRPLEGQKIKTYCAGLLAITAQETSRPRESFFPIPEGVAGGNTAANLDKMGLVIGEDFVSPSGALFSTEMQIAALRPPLYDPRREVEEAIFDHFSSELVTKTYNPSLSLYQELRLKVVELADGDSLVADVIRQQENVGTTMDLVAAAKAQSVIETLDEIAFGTGQQYLDAYTALTGVGRDSAATQVADLEQLRQRHADLYRRLDSLTPRQVRIELIDYYIGHGKAEIDRRFFGGH